MHTVRPEGTEPVTGLWKKLAKFYELSPDGFPDNPDKQKLYGNNH